MQAMQYRTLDQFWSIKPQRKFKNKQNQMFRCMTARKSDARFWKRPRTKFFWKTFKRCSRLRTKIFLQFTPWALPFKNIASLIQQILNKNDNNKKDNNNK